jgi:hypothetical protein
MYYKEVININLEYKKYSFFIAILKKKNDIAKIRMDSHQLCIETRYWENPKMSHGRIELSIFVIQRRWRMENIFS